MNPWSLFWRQGHSTTFGPYYKQGYEGAVADWWKSVLADLPPEVSVMEVGCGNCSLLPDMVKSGLKGKYIGVDLAAVKPSNVASEGLADSGIELVLHSETPAEELPEPDESIDLFASVFGIEYSNLDKSFSQAYRVLKSGGSLRALLHHNQSVVTGMSKRAYDEFNAEDFRAVINALTAISLVRDKVASPSELKSDAEAEKNRQILNVFAEKYLSDTNPATANATMFELMTQALGFFKVLGASQAQRQDFIGGLANEHLASHERFRQMMAVAFDSEGIDQLKSKLQALGFAEVRGNEVMTDENILAWELCAEK
jgi:ubiquinone/menaquinone biosynthesis C-methylase UbiE